MADVYTIRLVDKASAQAKKVERSLGAVEDAARRTASAFRSQDKAELAAARQAERLAKAEFQLQKKLLGTAKAAATNARAMNALSKATGKRGLVQSFQALRAAAGAAGATMAGQMLRSIAVTSRSMLEAAGNVQTLERNFIRITGDPAEFGEMRSLVERLGLSLDAGTRGVLKLRTTFGRVTSERLLKFFSAASLGADELGRATLALTQIQGRGKLQAEELNQFVEAVPGVDRGRVIDQIAKEMGILRTEAAAKLGKGQVAADVGIRALIFGAQESLQLSDPSGQRGFAGVDTAIEAQSEDISRKLTSLDNTIMRLRENIGKGLDASGATKALDAITSGLSALSKINPKTLGVLFTGLAVVVGLATVALIALSVAAVAAALPISAAAGAIIAGVIAISGAVAALWVAVGGWEGIKASLEDAWNWILGWFNTFKVATLAIAADFMSIGGQIVDGLVAGIVGGASRATDAIVGVARSVVDTAKGVFGIQSPARAFIEQGKFIDEGLAVGVDQHSDLAFQSAEDLAEGTIMSAQMAGTNLADERAMTAVGAAAGASAGEGSSGATMGDVNLTFNVAGGDDPMATADAVRSVFELQVGELFNRHLEAVGA